MFAAFISGTVVAWSVKDIGREGGVGTSHGQRFEYGVCERRAVDK